MNKEIAIIQRELKIPMDNVIFNEIHPYVEILSANINIGSLPFIATPGNIIYDTSNEVLFRLKWNQIYLSNQAEIDSEIYKLIGRSDVLITIGTFRRLYVKDIKTDTLICAVSCSYDTNWKVEKE